MVLFASGSHLIALLVAGETIRAKRVSAAENIRPVKGGARRVRTARKKDSPGGWRSRHVSGDGFGRP